MKKKMLSMVLAVVMAAMAFAGCGSSKAADAEVAKTETEKESAAVTTESDGKPVLRVAMECAYPPFNWTQKTDENGAVPISGTDEYAYGYDIMVAKMICEDMGYDLEIIKTDWDSIILGLQSNKWDAIIAGMGITEERKQSVDFSIPYKTTSNMIICRKDSPYANATSIDDLKGCKAITQMGTTWENVIPQIEDVTVIPGLGTTVEVTVAVQSGKADVAVFDDPTCISACMSNQDLTYVKFEEGKGFAVPEGGSSTCGVAVRKGETELLDKINAALEDYTEEEQDADMLEAIKLQPLSTTE